MQKCANRGTRTYFLASCLGIALLAFPRAAISQQAAFVQGILDLSNAIEGALGDEGARIGTALDAMSRALAEWDRQLATLEADVRSAPAFEKRLALGRMYATRGRFDDALRELDMAATMQPRADVHVLRGVVLDASGKSAEAAGAFRAASAVDRNDPVTAYYVFRHAASGDNHPLAQDALDALAAAHAVILKDGAPRTMSPFARIGLFQDADQTPILPLAAYSSGYARIARGDLEGAIAEWRKAAAADPLADPAARPAALQQAVAALSRGRLAEARTILEQSNPLRDSSEAHRVLGLIYWAESEYDKSIDQLGLAVGLNPGDERARLALSRVLSTAGRDADAERALLETVRLFPGSPRAHLWLASSYERSNRFADARQEFQRAVAGTVAGQSSVYGSIGRLASGAADVDGANDAFARAVAASPNDAAMRDVFAGSLLQDDRTDEAFAEFVAALLIDPLDAAAHAGIGQIYLNAGRHAEAVAALRRAVELAPANLEPQYALATALTRLGNPDEAKQLFARVEQVHRNILADRQRTLSLDVLREEAAVSAGERNYNRAAELWQQVVDREPARASNRVGLAAVLASAGRLASAIEQYERAVTLGAEPGVYLRLADLYEKAGRGPDAARARVMYEKVLQGDRTNEGAAR